MKKVAIYQPQVFPPLHYFNRIMNSDVWVVLSDVQLNRKVGQARFEVKMNGERKRLPIPVIGGNRVIINEAKIDYESGWTDSIQKTLQHAYSKAPHNHLIDSYFNDYNESCEVSNLSFYAYAAMFTASILRDMGWQGDILFSDDLGGNDLPASERMAELTERCGGDTYICGREGYEGYLNHDDFKSRGIQIMVQDWRCPSYEQGEGEFIPNLSILDALCNVGIESSKEIIMSGGTEGWKLY